MHVTSGNETMTDVPRCEPPLSFSLLLSPSLSLCTVILNTQNILVLSDIQFLSTLSNYFQVSVLYIAVAVTIYSDTRLLYSVFCIIALKLISTLLITGHIRQ